MVFVNLQETAQNSLENSPKCCRRQREANSFDSQDSLHLDLHFDQNRNELPYSACPSENHTLGKGYGSGMRRRHHGDLIFCLGG
jgi:hypothetical protein